MPNAYRVDAVWDESARAWIATSDDVPGLCAEAATLDALIEVVVDLAPELLVANGVLDASSNGEVPIRVVAERVAVAHRAA
ncbi:MAG TPA: DUF1902 domain-containing protein [Geminicoccaceae bacterium]|jgi:hypothetical protein|nr:DUF1902 domain-containing protein [Geminicoccaceae bacterium]